MIKELALQLYVIFIKLFFLLTRESTPKNKVVFVSTFLKNTNVIVPKLLEESNKKIVVYNFSNHSFDFQSNSLTIYNKFTISTHLSMLKDLATASDIVIDNYYPFLGASSVLRGQIIQTWHAVGAFKNFALLDHSLERRPKRATQRFKKAYKNIDYILNGSAKMGDIFKESFGLEDKNLLNFGMPSSDFYNNTQKINWAQKRMLEKYPLLKDKHIITYAPTYRDNVYDVKDIELDVEHLLKHLGSAYVLILRLHPAVRFDNHFIRNARVINLSQGESIESILSITDILITDYSSVAFDFSNFNKPIIFYPYDLKQYEYDRGFTDEYENLVSGNIVFSTDEIIQIIKSENFNKSDIQHFKNKWNEFSKGNNTELLVEKLK